MCFILLFCHMESDLEANVGFCTANCKMCLCGSKMKKRVQSWIYTPRHQWLIHLLLCKVVRSTKLYKPYPINCAFET